MNKEYKLKNRAHNYIKLIQDYDDIYIVNVDNLYYRVGFETDPKIDPIFIDPEDGPFISIGFEFSNIEVIDLFYENEYYKVKLKEK